MHQLQPKAVPSANFTPVKRNFSVPKRNLKLMACIFPPNDRPPPPIRSTSPNQGLPQHGGSCPPRGPAAPPPETEPEPLTLAQVLQPDRPTLKDDVPEKWQARDIANWVKQFDDIIQESATAIIKLLQTSGATENQLQEAAVRYGIPLLKVPKLSIRTLQQLVAIGAAMAC